ncbi:MAG TPA: hypothetical protein VGI40_26410, partial [Pirellulaceae bacterium]
MTLTRLTRLGLAATPFVVVLAFAAMALACNVPVFRFALERWSPDVYRVTVLHRGPLSEGQRELLRPLEDSQTKSRANVVVRAVDVSNLGKQDAAAGANWLRDQDWSGVKAGEALLVMQYPEHLRIEIPAWMGPLEAETIARLVRSPVRQELVRRLTEGQTAVWLLLECGDAEKDEAAAEFLRLKLEEIQPTLKLPRLTSDPDDELLASTPLKVEFSVLRVPHGAADEAALAGMLVRCEADLADRVEALAFPVFGRGRALWPLVGRGINAKNVQEACEFLVGACSCQVKDQNPGFDLLLSTDWDSLVGGEGQRFMAMQTRGLPQPDGATE